jgi:hypothetical protein
MLAGMAIIATLNDPPQLSRFSLWWPQWRNDPMDPGYSAPDKIGWTTQRGLNPGLFWPL